jgi:hypothetical protein
MSEGTTRSPQENFRTSIAGMLLSLPSCKHVFFAIDDSADVIKDWLLSYNVGGIIPTSAPDIFVSPQPFKQVESNVLSDALEMSVNVIRHDSRTGLNRIERLGPVRVQLELIPQPVAIIVWHPKVNRWAKNWLARFIGDMSIRWPEVAKAIDEMLDEGLSEFGQQQSSVDVSRSEPLPEASLSEREQAILRLFREEKTYAEIGDELGLVEGVVANEISRVRKRPGGMALFPYRPRGFSRKN